ncbi:hypothetical protein [Candidatus Nitrospira inopinata]|jgi:hypothetical protein|uniref:Uncharacterized protein n=1 Tax=Candidatus Nitrospira inopinata TaxID=1715989 RepID=A0A0S4KUD1_9BACT|nr:hypothetical protein [Candidatus Nitrospira inopinata]CUQ67975.1 conserved protein of unknown function [Candidatus Nitrospira inopinata]
MAPQDKKPKPVTTLRCSGIKASIWKNEGMNGPFYNVTVTRSYKGQDGVWKNSESFGLADLEALLVVAQQAKLWVTERSER